MRATLRRDAPAIEQHQIVGPLRGQIEVVRHHQHAEAAFAARAQHLEEADLMLQVEHCGGFVEHEIAGLLRQHTGEQHAASLAAAQSVQSPLGEVLRIHCSQCRQDRGAIRARLRHACAQFDGLVDAEGEARLDLPRQKADALRAGPRAELLEAGVVDLHAGTLAGGKQATQRARQGALAGTVGAQQAEKATGLERQIDSVEHGAAAITRSQRAPDECHESTMIAAYNGGMTVVQAPADLLRRRLIEAQQTYAALGDEFIAVVEQAAALGIEALHQLKGGIYILGNGGSAADAQHWAAELVGRYLTERDPLNVHALTVNSSTFTALVNDYPPEEVFERQVRAHVGPGDLLLAISTSGNSENVLRAVRAAKIRGARVVGVTGKDGGKLASMCDLAFVAPSSDTPRIQEAHLLFGHCFCELVEAAFTPSED